MASNNGAKGAHVWSATRKASQQNRRPKRDAIKKERHALQLQRESANKKGKADDFRYLTPWEQAKEERRVRRLHLQPAA